MGCSSSRVEKPCHEAALINGDESLLYKPHDILTIHESLKNCSKESQVSKKDLRSFLKLNKLASDDKATRFYKRLLKNDSFPVKHLASLATILCEGTVENKAKVLFESWAEGQALSKESFEELIDCLFNFSLEDLPTLATSPTKENYYTDDEMSHFLQRAKSGRDKAKLEITAEVFAQDTVDREGLTAWFSKVSNDDWLLSNGIREKLKEFGKKSRKEKKKATQSGTIEIECTQGSTSKIETGPQMEVIEEHHHHHQHHEHHVMKVDASE